MSILPANKNESASKTSPASSKQPFFGAKKGGGFFGASIQAKLSVNAPNDAYEQEADAVADQVVQLSRADKSSISHTPAIIQQKCSNCDKEELQQKEEAGKEEEQVQRKALSGGDGSLNSSGVKLQRSHLAKLGSTAIQKKCSNCEKEEVQRKEDGAEKEEMLQTKSLGDGADILQRKEQEEETGGLQFIISRKCASCDKEEKEATVQRKGGNDSSNAATENVEQVLRTPGQPLDAGIQTSMGEKMNADFSGVRIHTDHAAAESAQSIQAKAYTHQQHIVFGQGQYQPHTDSGQHLIAHELTHTLQQSGNTIRRTPDPVEDEPRNNKNIKYAEVIKKNRAGWTQGMRYWNIFKTRGLDPVNTPNAYANHVYDLQLQFSGWEGITVTGILDWNTMNVFAKVGRKANEDPAFKQQLRDANTDMDVFARISYVLSQEKEEKIPLHWKPFAQNVLLWYINRNTAFVLKKGDSGQAVIEVQNALVTLRYNIGAKGADGQYGDDTVKAVKQFQLESGFDPKEADGKLGSKTLQALDTRMAVRIRQENESQPGGTHYRFEIAVDKEINADEEKQNKVLLHAILQQVFHINAEQAKTIIDVDHWTWRHFSGVSKKDVDIGHITVGIPIEDYHKIAVNNMQKYGTSSEMPTDLKMKDLYFKLAGTDSIYERLRKLIEMENGVDAYRKLMGKVPDEMAAALKAEQEAVEKELAALGLTRDKLLALTSDFKKTFAVYAKLIALKMLDSNEKDTLIEMKKYRPNEPTTEGDEIKVVMEQLANAYAEADRHWWRGISIANGKGDTVIHDRMSYARETYCTWSHHPESIQAYCGDFFDEYEKKYRYSVEYAGANDGFTQCSAKNVEAYHILNKAKDKFPILAYPKLDLRANAQRYKSMSGADIEKMLFDKSEFIQKSIRETRESLEKNDLEVWKLPPVIAMAKMSLGITKDSIQDKLVDAEQKRFNDKSFWESIAMAALGLGLGLLALASGPIGWAALGASIAVGSYDAYKTYQDTAMQRAAANTSFDPAKALGNVEPSYFWFFVSLVTVGLDVFQGLKAIKALGTSAKVLGKAEEVAQATKVALAEDLLKIEDDLAKVAGKGGKEEAELLKAKAGIEKAIKGIDDGKFARNLVALKNLKDMPQHAVRLALAMASDDVAEAIIKLESLVQKAGLGDAAYKRILAHYGGAGADFVHELPETVKALEKSTIIKNSELFEKTLTDPRIQKVFLDHISDPDLIAGQWKLWKQAIAEGKVMPFDEFLKAGGHATEIRNLVSLGDAFSSGFSKLPNLTKNQQLLRSLEPALADAFAAGNVLPKRLQAEFAVILEKEIVGQTASLERAQLRMHDALRSMGAAIQTPQEYSIVMRLIESPQSRKVIFEAATSVPGYEEFAKGLARLKDYPPLVKMPGIMDELRVIGAVRGSADDIDKTLKWLIDNDKIRSMFIKNPDLVLALKKCASPCFPILATAEEIEKILGFIQHAKGKIDYARLNQFMYQHRETRELWEAGLKELEKDFKGTLAKVEMPKAKDIDMPASWAKGADKLNDFRPKTNALVAKGMAPDMLEKIYANAAKAGVDPTEFMENMARAGNFLNKTKIDNLSPLFHALAEGSDDQFRAAYQMMKRIGDYGDNGPKMAESIFSMFKMDDIVELRRSMALPTEELARAAGDTSYASFEAFYELATSIKGSREKVLELVKTAGHSGEPDLTLVLQTINRMGNGPHPLATVAAKLTETKAIAQKLLAAGDSFGDLLWGTTKKGGKYGVGKQFTPKGATKPSGSLAISHVMDQKSTIVKFVTGDAAEVVNLDQWRIVRKAISDSDLEPIVKNGLIGHLWEEVNLAVWRKKFPGKVWDQVKIKIKGTNLESVVDAVINENGQIIFKELKTGGAKQTDAQKAMEAIVKAKEFDKLEVVSAKASEIWPDGKVKVTSYDMVNEPK